MLRIFLVLTVAITGAAVGAIVGLLGGALIIESGHSACSGAGCGDVLVRTYIPAAAALGIMLGLAKGINLTAGTGARIVR